MTEALRLMKADTHTPAEIFGSDVRYLVPLFQRPYVWNRTDQWEPLWQDVAAVAEQILEPRRGSLSGQEIPPHFLGAIVLEQQWASTAYIPVRHVIDGQQRLTTLQILLDAAQLVAERHGKQVDARALQALVLNRKDLAQHPDERFKVWPTDRDQHAFRVVMDNDETVSTDVAASSIAQAHEFFVDEITAWAEPDGDPDKCEQRLTALTHALCRYLKLVVIDLEAGDNAQVIFETLNHRGTPLLAADLVKNFVFQMAAGQGEELPDLYNKYWKPFDSDHWRREVRQGRLRRPYVDIFLNYWLTMRRLKEVPADRVFTDFRDMVRVSELDAWKVMKDLANDGKVYADLEHLPWDSVEGTFYYRIIKTMETSVVGPFLLWVSRWPEDEMPVDQRHRALIAVESWLVRRMLCKATSKNYNRIMLDLLQHLDRVGPSTAGTETETFLASSKADAAYWPSDDDLVSALLETKIYNSLTRGRLRMVLEGLEDDLRGPWSEHQHCPRGRLTIEHIMPQGWTEHWGSDVEDARASLRRDQLVQTLGNLTLVNDRLNPALSNRPWSDSDTQKLGLNKKGKRHLLSEHSTLKLNAEVVTKHVDDWREDDIVQRSSELAARAARIWPRPAL